MIHKNYLEKLPPDARIDFKMKYEDSSVKCRYVLGTIRKGLVEGYEVYTSRPVSVFLYEMTKNNFLDKLRYSHGLTDETIPESTTLELILRHENDEVSCSIPIDQVESSLFPETILDEALMSLQDIALNRADAI